MIGWGTMEEEAALSEGAYQRNAHIWYQESAPSGGASDGLAFAGSFVDGFVSLVGD